MNTVATHSGSFQADEVFAVAILTIIYPEIKVIRTRDPDVYAKTDARVDVGLKYDPKTGDFDHHQKQGAGKRLNGIPYSSAGLVWKNFGMKLVDTPQEFERLDEKLFHFIDADDCGVQSFEPTLAKPYTISSLVKTFNPSWDDPDADWDKCFFETVRIAQQILEKEIKKGKSFSKAEQMTKEALKKSDGKIVVLNTYCPWKKTLAEDSEAIYVVYPSFNGEWKVQGIPIRTDSFEVRKKFPEEWSGLNEEALNKVTGISDAVFCHRGLWICASRSKESALVLAKKALDN